MWEFFIRNNRFSFLFIIALLGFGIFSIISIPKESAPEVEVPIGIVTTALPGAPAADVETLVTNEIERGLSGTLENVKKITSTSRESISSITVEFEAAADVDSSIQDLKDEIDIIKTDLPSDAEDPSVSAIDFVDQPIVTIAVAGDLSDTEFTTLGDQFEARVEGISGVSKVEKSGIREREINVVIEQRLLQQFELSITDVTTALRSSNTTVPIGQIISDGVSYNVAFEGDITSSNEIANVVVATRGGQPVYIRDIAVVEDGLAEARSISRLSVGGDPSLPSVSFEVYKRSGGDITAIAARVNEEVTVMQNEGDILADLTVATVLDSGQDISDDLIQLSTSGLQTIVLVVLVLIVAIGWREGLIAGLGIPLSFMIGFIGLYLSGNTINFISLFALILGIGVLVDSGIVMVEGINRRMKDDETIDKKEAAILTIREFSRSLTSGTLTTVSMFVGLFIVSGVTGQFIASIPFTLVFILLAALLVALGFLPLISSLVLKRRSATKLERLQIRYSRQLEVWYKKKLTPFLEDWTKGRLFILGILGGFAVALALIPLGLVQVVFFEESDVNFVVAEVELPQGSLKEQTDVSVRRIEDILYNEAIIESFVTTVGSGSAFGSGGSGAKFANVFITLQDERDATSLDFIEDLRGELSTIRDVKVTVSQPSNGPPTGTPVGITLLGDDLEELSTAANQVAIALRDVPGTTNVTTSANNTSTEYVVSLDKAKAAALGLSPQTISLALRSAVFGTDATSITTLTDDIDVVVKLNLTGDSTSAAANTNRTTIDAIKNLELNTPTNGAVLLSSIASVSLREASSVINHENQKRTVQVQSDITSEGNIIAVNREILQRIDDQNLVPDNIEITLGGETEDSNQAFMELFIALVVGIVLMIAVLVLQFNSYRHTLYVLSIIPFSLIGILVGLAITQSSLSFPSLMGFIALTGIVVNNSILLIDQMNAARRRNPEQKIQEMVVEAATSRLRPILLTTTTTVVGMIPLLYTDPIWVPLATAIMFGLAFSVVITLILVPIIYNRWPGTVRN